MLNKLFFVGFLNVIIGFDICFENELVLFIVRVFLYNKFFGIKEVFWMKNGE